MRQYPDHWTQGETREELEEMLKSLYDDIRQFTGINEAIPRTGKCTGGYEGDAAERGLVFLAGGMLALIRSGLTTAWIRRRELAKTLARLTRETLR